MIDFLQSDLFKEAVEVVKFRLDEASKREVNVFGQPWYLKHFNWDSEGMTEAEFTTLLGQLHYTIAASTINQWSADPVRKLDGYGKLKQEMLTYSHVYKLEAEDLRDIATYIKVANKSHKDLVNYIANRLMNVRERAINGIHERLDIIILGALSNAGVFTFTADNDPGSPYIGSQLQFGFDPAHIGTITTPWTDANIATVDVIDDIQSIVGDSVVEQTKMLMLPETAQYMLKTSKLHLYINGSDRASTPITLNQVNAEFERLGLPTIELVRKKSRTLKGADDVHFNPWKAGQILFVPDNNFGVIKSRLSDAEVGLKENDVDYSYYSRIEVANWVVGLKQGSNYTEMVRARVTAMPSMPSIADMYTVNVLNQ